MTMITNPLETLENPEVSLNIREFLLREKPPTPCLVMDLAQVAKCYQALHQAFPKAAIHYAVKANPERGVLQTLFGQGASFDIASPAELQACLSLGISLQRLSYNNTIKKAQDIAEAYRAGVRLFAFDSFAELEKLACYAPGAEVICRILVENTGAEWPLSRKFGCEPELALELLAHAQTLGLNPVGVSFHVGSQQTQPSAWDKALKRAAALFRRASVALELLDIGGGLPAHYRSRTKVPALSVYAEAIHHSVRKHFGAYPPKLMLEPGRSLVADAGVIQSEVVLISKKSLHDSLRWVYLDIGKFGGLAETLDEAIRYRFCTLATVLAHLSFWLDLRATVPTSSTNGTSSSCLCP